MLYDRGVAALVVHDVHDYDDGDERATMTSNATGTTTSNVALFERADVHKSCKALELVVNLFNDYCQAAESLSAMQKKLAKAVKDAAACKGTGEIVGASTLLNFNCVARC